MADTGSDLEGRGDLQAVRRHEISDTKALYSPLDASKREIRLLRLETDQDDRFFHGELRAFSLDDPPPFKALSYCWGQAMANRVIWINEQPFYVRPNLYAYLEIMRSERDVEWIFIDAICINQQDVAERSQQVALMGSVYRDAKLVVAWLGERQFLSVESGEYMSLRRWCDGTLRLEDVPDSSFFEFSVVATFLLNDYWNRLWIVQEVALAQDLVLRCSALELHAQKLFSILDPITEKAVAKLDRECPGWTAVMARTDVYLRPVTLILLRQKSGEWTAGSQPPVQSLSKAIGLYSNQTCAVDRDKIYGLLALTNSVCKVDYSAPKMSIYLQVLIEHLLGSSIRSERDIISCSHFISNVLWILGLSMAKPAVWFCTSVAAIWCKRWDPDTLTAIVFCLSLRRSGWSPRLGTPFDWKARITSFLTFHPLRHFVRALLRMPLLILPACDESGMKTVLQWHVVVLEIFKDVVTRLEQHGRVPNDLPYERAGRLITADELAS